LARLLLFLIVAIGLYLVGRWLFRQPPRVLWQTIAIAFAAGMLLLVVTGRAHWLTALFAALLPFLRVIFTLLVTNLPLLRRLLSSARARKASAQPRQGQASTVQSEYIRMTLDHDSGEIGGEVLAGRFAGSQLASLDLDELLELLRECGHDEDSAAMLQAYLDRVHGDTWRERAGTREQHRADTGGDAMSRAEALQVLGLEGDPSEDEIVDAHRRLMQKLHPDRGGSSYLAAKINQAKDTLLGS
jgi:high-affinity Fe2+/Pb2+ permease